MRSSRFWSLCTALCLLASAGLPCLASEDVGVRCLMDDCDREAAAAFSRASCCCVEGGTSSEPARKQAVKPDQPAVSGSEEGVRSELQPAPPRAADRPADAPAQPVPLFILNASLLN